jgi:proline iminopeptidase
LLELINGDDPEVRQRCLEALWRFEIKASALHTPDQQITAILERFPAAAMRQLSLIDLHYVTNLYFLEEGQLLRDAVKIRDIPITIVNGRYDVFCPPEAAYELHLALPKSKLVIVESAGHSEREQGTTAALLRAVAEFE